MDVLYFKWANNINTKVDDRTNVLSETMRQYKNHDTLSSPTVRTADQIHENLVAASFDKAVSNVALIFKSFYASIITKS